MSLQLIGAGFGRTGTLSLKLALEQLGVTPCYHMTEVLAHPEHVAVWSDAIDGKAVDWDAMVTKLIDDTTFGGRFADRAHAIGVYERHAETVQRAIPKQRLLVCEVAQGWPPLCAFLGLAVPAGEFPRVNSKDEFRARAGLQ